MNIWVFVPEPDITATELATIVSVCGPAYRVLPGGFVSIRPGLVAGAEQVARMAPGLKRHFKEIHGGDAEGQPPAF